MLDELHEIVDSPVFIFVSGLTPDTEYSHPQKCCSVKWKDCPNSVVPYNRAFCRSGVEEDLLDSFDASMDDYGSIAG